MLGSARLSFAASLLLVGVAFAAACDEGGSTGNSHPLPGDEGGGGSGASGTGGNATGGSGGAGTGGTGTAGNGTAGNGTGGAGLGGSCDGGGGAGPGPTDATVVKQGAADKLLLQGKVVTPDQAFDGEVLIEGDVLTCVAVSCQGEPGAATASVVATHGVILPGLIDTHNHILFDIFDEADWTPPQVYANHNTWTSEPRYSAMVDAKQYLNGESGSPSDLGCELDKYGELKGLIAGTTSIQGSATPGNRACYGSLSRTIDQGPNDLGADKMQTATVFPSAASAKTACDNITDDSTDAYVIHIAEGTNAAAKNEFANLNTITDPDGCLYAPETTIIHGLALEDAELTTMAQHGMSLVWSPRSNIFLYGGGSDMSKTADIPLALSKGINVAVAPDWSIGGSQNMLDELRYANQVDDAEFGDMLDAKALVTMATKNAAKALALDGVIGTLEVGKKADVVVVGGDVDKPYDALLAATPATVRLVLVGGVPLYGDIQLVGVAPKAPGCETLGVCCETKFLCAAEAGGTAANKLGQTFAEIAQALEAGLESYDQQDLSQWDFAPIAPLVKCP